jgi:hypothetical protein
LFGIIWFKHKSYLIQGEKSMRRSIFLLSVILIISLINGCKGPEGPAGPILTGDMIGYVILDDNNGNYLKDNSAVTVSLEGTGNSTTTAQDGRFVLSGVSAGTYNIVFNKSGYGITKIISYQFVGGGQVFLDHIYLNQIPQYTISDLTSSFSSGSLVISGKYNGVKPGSLYLSYAIFASSFPGVSSNPADYNFSYTNSTYNSDSTFSSTIYGFPANFGFQSGQTVYFIAYAGVGYEQYIDLATGKYFFPALNPTPSNVISVIVP